MSDRSADPQAAESPRGLLHLDEQWELEMAELADRVLSEGEHAEERGLMRYLRRLREHYGEKTPHDLSPEYLTRHARYLENRYRAILRHVEHLTCPEVRERGRLKKWFREHHDSEVYYQCVNGWRDKILHEMETAARYWHWVRQHKRLPHHHLPWSLYPFNDRPIAFPWRHVRCETLERLAEIESELRL